MGAVASLPTQPCLLRGKAQPRLAQCPPPAPRKGEASNRGTYPHVAGLQGKWEARRLQYFLYRPGEPVWGVVARGGQGDQWSISEESARRTVFGFSFQLDRHRPHPSLPPSLQRKAPRGFSWFCRQPTSPTAGPCPPAQKESCFFSPLQRNQQPRKNRSPPPQCISLHRSTRQRLVLPPSPRTRHPGGWRASRKISFTQ